jgi:AraC-like DNA-binding protein
LEVLVKESVRFARVADLDDLEFIRATFVTHAFPRHTHETFAIGVIEGGVQATDYRGATHIATAGDICLINPGEVHTGFSPHETGWTYRVFYPGVPLLEKAAEAVSLKQGRAPHFPSPVIRDKTLFRNLLQFLKSLESSDLSMEKESLLLSALAQMVARHADITDNTGRYSQREERAVRAAREYMEAYFTENVPLSTLARIAGVSEFHLLRLFRAKTGLPPHAYLIQKRIDHARKLLSRQVPIVQVALETGFSDQSHFTRHFKRILGVTPGDYCRKSNRLQEKE